MAIIAEKKGSDFKQIEPGTYVARCYSMVEIGTIEVEWQGKKKKAHKVNISWEFPTELNVFDEAKGEQPFVVSKTYSLSMHEKASLRKDLESWRGKKYTNEEAVKVDITKLIGQPCLLQVIHEAGKEDASKNYVVISSISKLMKGQECPKQINPTRILAFDSFDWDVFNSLPDYIKDKIKSSDEFKQMHEPNMATSGKMDENGDSPEEDDLPF